MCRGPAFGGRPFYNSIPPPTLSCDGARAWTPFVCLFRFPTMSKSAKTTREPARKRAKKTVSDAEGDDDAEADTSGTQVDGDGDDATMGDDGGSGNKKPQDSPKKSARSGSKRRSMDRDLPAEKATATTPVAPAAQVPAPTPTPAPAPTPTPTPTPGQGSAVADGKDAKHAATPPVPIPSTMPARPLSQFSQAVQSASARVLAKAATAAAASGNGATASGSGNKSNGTSSALVPLYSASMALAPVYRKRMTADQLCVPPNPETHKAEAGLYSDPRNAYFSKLGYAKSDAKEKNPNRLYFATDRNGEVRVRCQNESFMRGGDAVCIGPAMIISHLENLPNGNFTFDDAENKKKKYPVKDPGDARMNITLSTRNWRDQESGGDDPQAAAFRDAMQILTEQYVEYVAANPLTRVYTQVRDKAQIPVKEVTYQKMYDAVSKETTAVFPSATGDDGVKGHDGSRLYLTSYLCGVGDVPEHMLPSYPIMDPDTPGYDKTVADAVRNVLNACPKTIPKWWTPKSGLDPKMRHLNVPKIVNADETPLTFAQLMKLTPGTVVAPLMRISTKHVKSSGINLMFDGGWIVRAFVSLSNEVPVHGRILDYDPEATCIPP